MDAVAQLPAAERVMLVRSCLNFAAHLAAGVAFGALAVIVMSRVSHQARGRLRTRTAHAAGEPQPETEE
jgi:hypothetical protein